jgi:hypothetical protein
MSSENRADSLRYCGLFSGLFQYKQTYGNVIVMDPSGIVFHRCLIYVLNKGQGGDFRLWIAVPGQFRREILETLPLPFPAYFV